MESIVTILLTSITLLTGMFALGGSSILYMKYRTRLLKLISIFISSIILISFNFWSQAVFNEAFIISDMISFIGCILCIIILPYLTMSLLSKKLSVKIERVIWAWNLLYIASGILNYVLPVYLFALPTVAYMMLISIAFWTFYLAINIKGLNNKLLKRSLKFFIYLTIIFLILLIFDYLITNLPIRKLEIVDNSSLTFYFLGLNIAIFFFAGGFLNREAYMVKGKLTSSFLENFKLTPREGEIIEKAYKGKTNKEIGEELFIATKTVENHLSNIYQKMQIKNKKMLIIELNTWKTD